MDLHLGRGAVAGGHRLAHLHAVLCMLHMVLCPPVVIATSIPEQVSMMGAGFLNIEHAPVGFGRLIICSIVHHTVTRIGFPLMYSPVRLHWPV